MKKKAVLLLCALVLYASGASAAYTQNDIYSALSKALEYEEASAVSRNSPGSYAADYYIMALSRTGRDYDYSSYIRQTENLNPSTKSDGQRIIMASAACGNKLSDSFVGMYTYNSELTNAADLAGAIITIESCGYGTGTDEGGIDDMVCSLLTMQQSDGSFANDVTTTAKALIALSYRQGYSYELSREDGGEPYPYAVDDGVNNAVAYLDGAQGGGGGYGTVSETAYVITALNSVGIDPDMDGRFASDGSPVSAIVSMIGDDGSVNGSADDTAMAAMALVSQVRAMQGKANFFDFTDGDRVSVPQGSTTVATTAATTAAPVTATAEAKVEPSPTADAVTATASATTSPTHAVISINPRETKVPEHSSVSEEEYGPFQFVGPLQADEESGGESPDTVSDEKKPIGAIAAAVIGVIATAAFAALMIIRKKRPEWFGNVSEKMRRMKQQSNSSDVKPKEPDMLEVIDKPSEVVPEEELYDPDFIKKLIPVDELSESVDGLVRADEESTDNGDTDGGTEDGV